MRALALSRNIATIKVAETAGYDEVAGLWRRVGAGTPPRPYPSIALGVFEATPLQVAAAYIYDRALTAQEMNDLIAALGDRFGISP